MKYEDWEVMNNAEQERRKRGRESGPEVDCCQLDDRVRNGHRPRRRTVRDNFGKLRGLA